MQFRMTQAHRTRDVCNSAFAFDLPSTATLSDCGSSSRRRMLDLITDHCGTPTGRSSHRRHSTIPTPPVVWQRRRSGRSPSRPAKNTLHLYLAPNGHYAADPRTLGSGRVVTHGPLTAIAGVYNYADAMPTQSWRETNYYVDVVFIPRDDTADASAAADSSSDRAAGPLRLRAVDGGPSFYDKFVNHLPSDPGFFPIGVWFESVTQPADIAKDQAVGLNTYVELTANTDLGLIEISWHACDLGGTAHQQCGGRLLDLRRSGYVGGAGIGAVDRSLIQGRVTSANPRTPAAATR